MKKDFYHLRPSYAFLMEMLWVCGFFVLCSGIFVSLFIKANSLSTQSKDLNYAITLAQSKIETAFSNGRDAHDDLEYYTANWQLTTNENTNCYAKVSTTCTIEKDLLTVSVVITQVEKQEPIYTLTGSHYLLSSE